MTYLQKLILKECEIKYSGFGRLQNGGKSGKWLQDAAQTLKVYSYHNNRFMMTRNIGQVGLWISSTLYMFFTLQHKRSTRFQFQNNSAGCLYTPMSTLYGFRESALPQNFYQIGDGARLCVEHMTSCNYLENWPMQLQGVCPPRKASEGYPETSSVDEKLKITNGKMRICVTTKYE